MNDGPKGPMTADWEIGRMGEEEKRRKGEKEKSNDESGASK